MVFLIISGEILILPNFKWVLGEEEESSLLAQDHYLPDSSFFKKIQRKVLLDQIPATKIEDHWAAEE